jgi:hypothetical protein
MRNNVLILIVSSISIQAQDAEVEVQLLPGWTIISINVIPPPNMWLEGRAGAHIPLMFERVLDAMEEDGELIVRSMERQFYTPRFNFNNIPFWDLQRGLVVNVDQVVDVVWEGAQIEADAVIFIDDGLINTGDLLLPYYPTYHLNAHNDEFYVVAEIIDRVVSISDNEGRYMIPEYNFSNMNPWRPGQAYFMINNLGRNEEIEFRYPEERDEELVNFQPGDHWESPINSLNRMKLLVVGIEGPNGFETGDGDQIAAFTDDNAPHNVIELGTALKPTGSNLSLLVLGLHLSSSEVLNAVDRNGTLVGRFVIGTDGRCGLAIWGDDLSTPTKDGLSNGEAFRLMINEEAVKPMVFHAGESLTYETDDFIVIDVNNQVSIPNKYYVSSAFPNPFNDRSMLNYGLPESGKVRIDLFDISGRHLRNLGNFEQIAGNHSFELNAYGLGSGLFLISVRANEFSSISKIVLMKKLSATIR